MVVDTPIIVTESSRIHLWRLVYLLGWAEAIAGVALMVLVSYPIATLTKHLPAHELLLYNVYYAQLFIGIAVTVVSIDGILVNRACLYNPFLASTKTAFKLWFSVGINLTFVIIVCIVVIPTAIDKSGEELIELLHWGSRYYLTDLSWKQSFDSIHQDFKCCGVHSLNDWLTNRWLPLELLRPEIVDLQDSVLEDGSLTVRVVPASCCDPDLRVECFHDYLQQNRTGLRPELVMAETVFTRGCGSLILDSVQWVTPPFMALTSVIVTFKIGQLFIGRCLYNLARRSEIGDENSSKHIELADRDLTTQASASNETAHQFSLNAPSSRGTVEQYVSLDSFEGSKDEIPVYAAQIETVKTPPSLASSHPNSTESSEVSSRTIQCKASLRPARASVAPTVNQPTVAMSLPTVRITPETIRGRVVSHRGSRDEPPPPTTNENEAPPSPTVDNVQRCPRRRVHGNNKYEYDLLQPVDFSKLF